MMVVETLLVRDEADVVEAHLAFHLNAGVDVVVATDHESRDGTTEVLERFTREGHVRLISERGPLREAEWRTRMARVACGMGADWVVNADADQFWWARGAGLKDVLAAVPRRFSAILAFDRVFVPRPLDCANQHFAERMIHRLSSQAALNAPASTYRPLARVIHRGERGISVSLGNHAVAGLTGSTLPGWHPVEVLHFPWRSPEQMARKSGHFVRAGASQATTYHAEAHRAVTEQRATEHYRTLAVQDDALHRGYAAGVIVEDTRLRDRLRALAGTAPRGAVAGAPRASDEVALAVEAGALRDAGLVRASRLLDRVEQRVGRLESGATLLAEPGVRP